MYTVSCRNLGKSMYTDGCRNPGGSDKEGLVVVAGILVEAMRKGHWIILDELNLAPSDVLEALNRVWHSIPNPLTHHH